MVNREGKRPLPMFTADLVPLFRQAVRSLIKRHTRNPEKNSIRKLARMCGISHPTFLACMRDDKKVLMRRTMVKIITKTFPKRKTFVKPRLQSGGSKGDMSYNGCNPNPCGI